MAVYDALETDSHQAFADQISAGGVPDLVIAATGVLIPQEQAERDVRLAATMIETNFTGHVTALLAFGEAMRQRGSGTIVVLSSVAAVRPRKFNSVYGATKAALDAFARGYADSLHGTGVRVLLVRPGFVIGKMTEGMTPAPLATTPARGRGRGRQGAARLCVRRLGAGPAGRPGHGDEADTAAGLADDEGLAGSILPGYPYLAVILVPMPSSPSQMARIAP